jgi:methylmalonyl-CoA mutase cobalamin-binding subunit/DNA-binding transcriptional MerR regulator
MSGDRLAFGPSLTIAAVERDTRIGKDTLRVWERRYGFPQPVRDTNGERLYPPDQVDRLRHVKRLLDAGHRPGRIVSLSLAELIQLGEGVREADSTAARPGSSDEREGIDVQKLLAMLRQHDVGNLRRTLGQSLLRLGIERFVTDLAVPALIEVGQGWARGQLEVFEEHLFSDTLETVLRAAVASAPDPMLGARPRVVLTTFPLESHGLGLQMADALFMVHGCANMNLGRQTPMADLVRACLAHDADIVALSFSAATHVQQALDNLAELRQQLPARIEIWAGSPLTAMQRRQLDGVRMLPAMQSIVDELQRWRSQRT